MPDCGDEGGSVVVLMLFLSISRFMYSISYKICFCICTLQFNNLFLCNLAQINIITNSLYVSSGNLELHVQCHVCNIIKSSFVRTKTKNLLVLTVLCVLVNTLHQNDGA